MKRVPIATAILLMALMVDPHILNEFVQKIERGAPGLESLFVLFQTVW